MRRTRKQLEEGPFRAPEVQDSFDLFLQRYGNDFGMTKLVQRKVEVGQNARGMVFLVFDHHFAESQIDVIIKYRSNI